VAVNGALKDLGKYRYTFGVMHHEYTGYFLRFGAIWSPMLVAKGFYKSGVKVFAEENTK
jgi:hypothetical protein